MTKNPNKSKDLRIGNLIYYHFDNKELNPINVTLETIKNICYENYGYECFVGIPLGVKWLEKIGFRFIKRNMWELKIDFTTKLQWYENQDDYITLLVNNYKNGEKLESSYLALKHIRHINEVQNLFHSLAGYDLVVT
jgi:hypothetical protein